MCSRIEQVGIGEWRTCNVGHLPVHVEYIVIVCRQSRQADGDSSLVGVRRVIKRVLHAGREQHGGCHSHHIYILSCFHIVFLPLLEKFPYQCHTGIDGAPPVLCLVAAAYTHTVNDLIFFKIGIQVAQTEVEIKV